MVGEPRIRLNNLKTCLRFPCLSLKPIIDSNNLGIVLVYPSTYHAERAHYHTKFADRFFTDEDDDSDSEVEEYSGMEQPPLIKQLKGILAEYPDDGQIIKVGLIIPISEK